MGIEKFTDLQVWQEAHQLVLRVYALTREFPGDEKYGLVSQMRRAAVSIPVNIAEGFKRRRIWVISRQTQMKWSARRAWAVCFMG